MSRRLTVRLETWPLASAFRISRGAKTEAHVVVAEIADGPHTGRGEAVPYPRYDETPEGTRAEIEGARDAVEAGMTRDGLLEALPPGAARNALDCALWDLEAKQAARPAWALAGLEAPQPCVTAVTLSLDTPERHGRGRGPPRRASPAQAQGHRRGRPRPHPGSPRERARCPADRGRERGLDRADAGGVPAGLRRPRGRDGGAAAAGGGRCGARRPAIRDPALRRRELPHAGGPDAARRPLPDGQHQAGQDRGSEFTEALHAALASGGAGHGVRHHGGQHGRHLARHGTGGAARGPSPTTSTSMARCCWPATARRGSATTARSWHRRSPHFGDSYPNSSPQLRGCSLVSVHPI